MRAHDRPLTSETLFVYPTALKAESVLRGAARARGCLLGHRVTTFPQLTEALARDLGVTAHVLDPALSAIVLARALERSPVQEPLRKIRRGLVQELLGVLRELKAAYLDAPDVAAIAGALPGGSSAALLADLARVYAAYDTELRRLGAVDRHGREWAVCEGLAAAEAAGRKPATLHDVGRIVFAEIYDFSVLQFLIATSLIRLVGDAELIAFAHPENVDATRFLERTWNRFVGDAAIADQVLPSFAVRTGRQGSLAAALRGVFASEPTKPAAPDGSIRLVVAPNRYREVEAAGRDIRRRLECGEPPERMAFLARDMRLYGELIEDVCRRFRIPIHFRQNRPLVASPFIKACVNVVRCVVEGFPRSRLRAVLDTDYLRAGGPSLVRALERSGFVAETARPLAECIAHAAAASGGDDETAARRRALLETSGARLSEVLAILRGLEGTRTVAAHAAALTKTLKRLGLRPLGRDDLPATMLRRDARAAAHLEETLAGLTGVTRALGMGPVPLADFLGILLDALQTQEIEEPTTRAGSVRALSVADARGLDFDTVYLLGLDDGTFPMPRRESPLLPDALRRVVNARAATALRAKLGPRADGLPLGGLLRTAREASLEDPFLFFLALSMAEQQLVLSYPAVDERGNATVASPFVEEVAICLAGGLSPQILSPTALVPEPEECAEPAELVARAALDRWAPAPAPPDRLTPALRAALPDGHHRLGAIDRRARIEDRRSRYFLSPRGDETAKALLADAYVGRLGGDREPLAARLGAMRWSPTRLEALGRCGFKFFARYALGLDDRREPALEVEAREQGTLFHRVLEEFLAANPALPAEREAARALGRTFLEAVRVRAAGVIPAKDAAFLGVSWRRLEAMLDELVVLEHQAHERRRRAGVEIERRLERSFTFELAGATGEPPLVLTGSPDRVEVERRGRAVTTVRVLDYKVTKRSTGYAALLDPEKELGRTGFQIPVYLLGALADDIEGVSDETRLEGGFVLLLASGEKSKVKRLPRELLGLVGTPPGAPASIADRIHALVAGAREGRFDVDPTPCDPWCAFRAVCRYQPPPLEDEAEDG